jgi:predicted DsbA family dithiol-disulfide isomerase
LLEELFAGQPVDVEQMMAHLRKTAADLGLPFGARKKTYNSRLAQEMGLWAESKDMGDPFHLAVFRAYFVDGKNIAKTSVLLDLAYSLKLDREEAETVLQARSFKDEVDADWFLSREEGITAVPTVVINGDKLVGAQPYAVLAEFMGTHGVRKRN